MLQVHVSSENMCNSISTIGNRQGWGGVWGVTLAAENYVASVRSGNYLLSCLRLKPIAIFFALVCSPCRHNSLASTLHSVLPLSIRLRLHSANRVVAIAWATFWTSFPPLLCFINFCGCFIVVVVIVVALGYALPLLLFFYCCPLWLRFIRLSP